MKQFFMIVVIMTIFSNVLAKADEPDIIPKVKTAIVSYGALDVPATITYSVKSAWEAQASAILNEIMLTTGIKFKAKSKSAILQINQNVSMKQEHYRLMVNAKGITIEASETTGVVHALATLAQLLMADGNKLSFIDIVDGPRFVYRGLMIDCSRHFRTSSSLENLIRVMALFKFNALHLHLSDNQGWRFAMDKYPHLAKKGTYYENFPQLSGRYYTKSELCQLVDFAHLHGIEIVPEIDLPGHCIGLLSAMPWLSCRGGKFSAYPEEEPDKQRTGENMLCLGNDSTYIFVSDLINELTSVFSSKMIHLGGDEVSTHIWRDCPKCQSLCKRENIESIDRLQDYFTIRVSDMLRTKGRKLVGWEEINLHSAARPGDVIMAWQTDGTEQQSKSVKDSLNIIMCPKDPCYFDFGYIRNSIRKVYEWEPVNRETAQNAYRVLGGQACLWTEFVDDDADMQRMLFPRACAIAETLWLEQGRKSWKDFKKRLSTITKMLDKMNVAYFNDEYIDAPYYVPAHNTRAAVKESCGISTNMAAIKYYEPENAYDGNISSFFATPYSLDAGSHFTVSLDNPRLVEEIEVLFDTSKEHPAAARLLVSVDGESYVEVARIGSEARLAYKFIRPTVLKSLKMELTAFCPSRLSIREIILK